MRRTRGLVLAGGLLLALAASCGPHMDRQVSLRPYKRELPPMPAHTVPTTGADRVPTAAEAAGLKNPQPASPETVAAGQRYYGYYCAQCHGPDGRGQVPVGESYDPRPADLTDPRLRALSDGELYRRMLTGRGHDPVMPSTVSPDRRWAIVDFLRSLSGPSAGQR
jgi:mono/diheme cytochrome c family protein